MSSPKISSKYIEIIVRDIIKYETEILKVERSDVTFIHPFALKISLFHPEYSYYQYDLLFGKYHLIKKYYEEFKKDWAKNGEVWSLTVKENGNEWSK